MFLSFSSRAIWGTECVHAHEVKQELSVCEWEENIASCITQHFNSRKYVAYYFSHIFVLLRIILYFFTLLRPALSQASKVPLTLTGLKLGFRSRWAHTEVRSLLTLKPEDIQIWSRLGSYSFEIVLYFPILLTGSLLLAGSGTMWWCTCEPHSPNRRPTKKQGLPLQLTHKHQEQTVT